MSETNNSEINFGEGQGYCYMLNSVFEGVAKY